MWTHARLDIISFYIVPFSTPMVRHTEPAAPVGMSQIGSLLMDEHSDERRGGGNDHPGTGLTTDAGLPSSRPNICLYVKSCTAVEQASI